MALEGRALSVCPEDCLHRPLPDQTLLPSNYKQTDKGVFGSKFVTICATGDKENQITMQGYQVSNQCMALVKDKILVPTKGTPELAFTLVPLATLQDYSQYCPLGALLQALSVFPGFSVREKRNDFILLELLFSLGQLVFTRFLVDSGG